MTRRTFLQSVIAVPLVAVGMPRVDNSLVGELITIRRGEEVGRIPMTLAECARDFQRNFNRSNSAYLDTIIGDP